MDKQVIKNLGLTDYETEIFLCLTRNGPLSVYEISKKTGLYRQVCYDSLNRLQEKGFASFVTKNGKKIFQAISPEKISEFLDEQKKQFENFLPELLKLHNLGNDEISVEVFKGKNVVRIALRDIINSSKGKKGEVFVTAVDEHLGYEVNRTAMQQYERDLFHYGIKEKVIIKKGAKAVLKRGNSEYAFIDEKYFNPNPSIIYAEKVQILMWGSPNYLIIIKNKNIAESFRKQFNLMWDFAKGKRFKN